MEAVDLKRVPIDKIVKIRERSFEEAWKYEEPCLMMVRNITYDASLPQLRRGDRTYLTTLLRG